MTGPLLATNRLILRGWSETDREPFAEMNADPRVMEFLPARLTRAESDSLIDRFEQERSDCGFCPWAAELRASGEFIGFVGLHALPEYLPFAPGIEVGWRLARRFWGHGYATETAMASLTFGFEKVGLEEIVAMTSVVNARSRRVMERLGMTCDPKDDFEHPHVSDDILRPHVLYRLHRSGTSFRA